MNEIGLDPVKHYCVMDLRSHESNKSGNVIGLVDKLFIKISVQAPLCSCGKLTEISSNNNAGLCRHIRMMVMKILPRGPSLLSGILLSARFIYIGAYPRYLHTW